MSRRPSRGRARKEPVVPLGVFGVAAPEPSAPLDLPAVKRAYLASRDAARARERAWEREVRRRDAVILHPTRTRFRRAWTRRGRALNAQVRLLKRRIAEKREQLAAMEEEEYRRTEVEELAARFRAWNDEENQRIRQTTFKSFRRLEPHMTDAQIERRIREHYITADMLPVDLPQPEDDDGRA